MMRFALSMAMISMVCTIWSGQVFYWRGGGEWRNWDTSANWSVTRGVDDNPQGLLPTSADTIWAYGYGYSGENGKYGYFDLNGGAKAIAGFDAGSAAGTNWKTYYLHITNGTLTISNPTRPSTASVTHSFKIYPQGGLVFSAGTGIHCLGISGLYSNWEVGGRMEVRSDELQFGNVNCWVPPGGTMVFDPGAMCVSKEISKENVILNQGTFIAPRGLLWNGSDFTSPYQNRYTKTLRIQQDNGTMILGGGFTKTKAESSNAAIYEFTLSGGTIVASNTVSFYNSATAFGQEVSAKMSKSASVEVLADSSLDMSLFTYSPLVTLTKIGPGPLTLKDLPAVIAVNTGKIVLTRALAATTTVSGAAGTEVEFGAADNAAPAGITGYSGMNFAVTPGVFGAGDVVITSNDADFLADVCEKLAAQAPVGAKASVSGGAVRFVVNTGHVFSAQGEARLDNPSHWNDGEIPAGEKVHLSGAETVGIIDSSVAAFSAISVEDGATLKVVGSGVTLPTVTLARDARLWLAEEATLSLGQGTVVYGGDESGLPVLEIGTNAVCTVPGGYVFKNVDLRLYGQVRLDENTSGYITFGGTADDETAYFAMTSIGGSVYARGSSISLKRFVYPGAGGCVKIVGTMLFRDFQFLPSPFADTGADGYNGFYFGNNNPPDERFDVILDNTTFPVIRNCYVSGGARVVCRNGGGFRKPAHHPGVATTFVITAKAQVRMEGPDSGIEFSHAEDGNFSFSPNADNYDALTLVDGAYVNCHDLGGNFVRLVVSNGVWCVPSLPMVPLDHIPYPPDGDARNWITNAFCCFRGGVSIEPNSTLFLKSADGLGGTAWNRHMTLADHPFLGGGSLMLTNGTPGYAFSATLVSGANTCTGSLGVLPGDGPTTLYLNDGANWAGSVRSAGLAFTNIASAAAAAVELGGLMMDGTMTVRIWPAQGTNDTVKLLGGIAVAGGRVKPVSSGGTIPAGYSFVLGTCPESVTVPPAADWLARGWIASEESVGDGRKAIVLTHMPVGSAVLVR